ncbi:hypothetical protein G9P44_001259 [Scheffersomyces stipitis]|nr:hypothetical protein G9P44_001259 [Scheffersomyces stipitis]
MSNRLESLNSKKPGSTPGPKTSLKFKPKVVPRKSKEDRAKEAPIQVKEEPNSRSLSARGGRGGARGGRGRGGRNNYAGTHLVSSGPLSSGSVSIGNASGSKLGLTADRSYNSVSPSPEFLQNLKLKDRTKSPTPGLDSDEEEDDPTKINMTQQYRFADEETVLFPVRPERDEEEGADKEVIKIESSTTTRDNTPGITSTIPSRETTVKSEHIDEKLEQILQNKAKLQNRQIVDVFDREEASKMITDHQEILDMLTSRFGSLTTESVDVDENTEEIDKPQPKYITMQLPKVLPEYTSKSTVKSESEPEEINNDDSTQSRTHIASHASTLRGQIGHLNIHQSGKFTINIGSNINLGVSKGVATNFLQELVVIDLDEQEQSEDVEMMDEEGKKVRGRIIRLGEVDGKIIGTPLIS